MMRVGQHLAAERLSQGLTLEEVAKVTKIKLSFLSAIEAGEYEKLPEKTYAQGFVRNYVDFLGLPRKEMMALFRREFNQDTVFKVLPEGFARKEDFSISKMRFGSTVTLIFLISSVLLTYILFQYRYAVFNPPLEVTSPKEGEIVASEAVTINGKTDPNATVFVNNEAVSVEENGTFSKNIFVFPGKTIVKVTATNRFGKTSEVQRSLEVNPNQ